MKRYVENGDLIQVKVFVRRNEINLQTACTDTIIQWIYNIKEMIKKASKFPRNDIRRYFEIRGLGFIFCILHFIFVWKEVCEFAEIGS